MIKLSQVENNIDQINLHQNIGIKIAFSLNIFHMIFVMNSHLKLWWVGMGSCESTIFPISFSSANVLTS